VPESSPFHKPQVRPNRLNLPHLKNADYDYVSDMVKRSGLSMTQCPTCRSREWHHVDGDTYGWTNGTYRLNGQDNPCDCETQISLRNHYLLANIGDQYMRLNWDEFTGSEAARDAVRLYLDRWASAKAGGMGIEFSSPNLGVGKTFAATHIGKELVKRGEAVFFLPFLEVIGLLSKDNDYRNDQEARLRDTTVLILDEVVPAISVAQNQLFASKFEELIRYRTNFNRVTIMTTNLTPDQLRSEYPRTYSLLEAKQIRVEMTGNDARQGVRSDKNLELFIAEEIEPIT